MHDDILESCARGELLGSGMDEDSADAALAVMRSQGMFDMPPPDVVARAEAESDDMALDDGPDPDVTEQRRAWRAGVRADAAEVGKSAATEGGTSG